MTKLWPVLLLVALSGPALAQETTEPTKETAAPPRCSGIEGCVDELIAQAERGRQPGDAVEAQLVAQGAAAVDRLVPLLSHPSQQVRDSAGLVLTGFPRIDPKHLPALVHAWRNGDLANRQGRGNGWMPRPIAATGTDEALRLLWQDFLRDPREGSNAQVLFGLASLGDRVSPLVSAEMSTCASRWSELCEGLVQLLHEFDRRWPRPTSPVLPPWGVEALVNWTRAALPEARRTGAYELGRLGHPAALAPLQQQLSELRAVPGDRDGSWEARSLFDQVADYGGAARASAPAIARYLAAGFDNDLRADAALALGRLGDGSVASLLLTLAPEFTDDWLLAYNVAESLGRLRSAEARPLLDRLAREHWHRGVRNNAARALRMIAGGPFARPHVAGDGAPYPPPRGEEGEEYLYMGKLRYAGDDPPRWCSLADDEREIAVDQDPVASISWPRGRSTLLNFPAVEEAVARRIRKRIPVKEVQGEVVAVLPVRGGELVAFNGGEFGGGLFHLPARGAARRLLSDPVTVAWLMGGRLYVAAGLSHLSLDEGWLHAIELERLQPIRSVRLPASAWRLAASPKQAVVLQTAAGHVAVREDGTLVDVETIDECGAD